MVTLTYASLCSSGVCMHFFTEMLILQIKEDMQNVNYDINKNVDAKEFFRHLLSLV